MSDVDYRVAIEIRPAVREDAEGIADIFLESAAYHVELDPERYSTPAVKTISARYREGPQHPADAHNKAITLVAACSGEIIGFIDVPLEQSSDAMCHEMTYCHISEIAVRYGHQKSRHWWPPAANGRRMGAKDGCSVRIIGVSHRKRAPVCSIRSEWAIAQHPSQP